MCAEKSINCWYTVNSHLFRQFPTDFCQIFVSFENQLKFSKIWTYWKITPAWKPPLTRFFTFHPIWKRNPIFQHFFEKRKCVKSEDALYLYKYVFIFITLIYIINITWDAYVFHYFRFWSHNHRFRTKFRNE